MTAYDGRTIRLRAGYSPAYKKATLVHELGHRLVLPLPRTAGLDDHRLLYLFLYDVWTDLYGRAFADRMVAIERRIPGRYDYDAAWTWALAMTREERQARLRALRATVSIPASGASGEAVDPVEHGRIGARAVEQLHQDGEAVGGVADVAQDAVDGAVVAELLEGDGERAEQVLVLPAVARFDRRQHQAREPAPDPGGARGAVV